MSRITAPCWLLAAALLVCGCGGSNEEPAPAAPDTATAPTAPAAVPREPVINGPEKIHDPEGRLQQEGDRKNGLRHGVWTSYFSNGRVQSRNAYRDGKLEGISTVFRENGATYYTGQHRNGKQVGEWRFFDEAGNLERTAHFDTTGALIIDP